jgi:hypothetical protein
MRVNCLFGRDVKVEHEQGHRYSEDAVAQGSKAFQALARNIVVVSSQGLYLTF